MKQLTCEMCGSTDLVKQDGYFVCQSCGCKYSVEEAKKMMIEGTVEVKGTVKTDLSDQVNNLLDRVKNFIKKSEWEKAYDYIEKILDLNNACPEAYYYKMLAILKKSSMDEININEFIECDDEEFDEEREGNEYCEYRRYGGEPIKTVLYDEIKNGEFDIALKMKESAELNSLQHVRSNLGELQSSFWIKGKTLLYSNIRTGRVVIPDGITKIDDGAFYGNEIDELVLSDSVVEIGERSFSIGTISKIKWSQNLKKIGISAFEEGFDDSYDIDLPDSVEFVGRKAFFNSYSNKAIVRIPPKVKVLNTTININETSTLEVDTTFGWALNLSPSENYFNFDYRNKGNIISKSVLSSPIKLAALLKNKDWAMYKLTDEDEEFKNSRMMLEIKELRNSAELAVNDKNYFEAENAYENILKINLEDIDAQFKLSCCRILCLEPYHYADYHNNNLYGEANLHNRLEACSRLEALANAPQELIEPLIKSIVNSSQNIEDKHSCIKTNMDLSMMVANDLYYFIKALNGELRQNLNVYNAHRISYKLLDRFGEIVFKFGGTEYINDICIPCWRDALEKCRMVMESVFYDFAQKEIMGQDLLQIEAKLVQYDHAYKKQETTPPVQKNAKGGCYVATCVYGSYDCPEVWTLRRYRDDNLASTWYGRAFIKIYYAISPTLVKWFGKTKWFKKIWKGKLDRMVAKLQKEGVESTPYNDKKW